MIEHHRKKKKALFIYSHNVKTVLQDKDSKPSDKATKAGLVNSL